MDLIFFAWWFFLPAGLANSTPVFAKKLPFLRFLNAPMDFGISIKGTRLFGPNKTWRGLISGICVGALTSLALYSAFPSALDIIGVAPKEPIVFALVLGGLLGFGALLGDAIESFFKRRARVPAGDSWFPFDQLDYVIGGLLASSIVVQLEFSQYIVITIVWFCLHLISVYIGFLLGIRAKAI